MNLKDYLTLEVNHFDHSQNIQKASMPPASWYSSREFNKIDNQAIFRKNWQPVARIDELNQTNSYISGCFAGTPWVITRNQDNKINAFFNICRHKGREVVTGKGQAPNGFLTCGYHGWQFNTTGQLKRVPRQDKTLLDFDKSTMNLKPMAVEIWGHWIFINPDPYAKKISSQLPELTNLLEKRNWSNLKYHSNKSWTINCNWKVYIDNYLDGGYHIPHMHPSLNQQLDMSSYQTVTYDTYSIQSSAPTKHDSEVQGISSKDRIGDGSIYAWVFPNFMINLYGNCLDINLVKPIDQNTCEVYYEFYFENIDDNEFIQSSIIQSDITQKEDIEICESVQLGLNSGNYIPGRYLPNVEQGEHHFHQLLAKNYLNTLRTKNYF